MERMDMAGADGLETAGATAPTIETHPIKDGPLHETTSREATLREATLREVPLRDLSLRDMQLRTTPLTDGPGREGSFMAMPVEAPSHPPHERSGEHRSVPDFSSALDLIKEASEAIRFAEERASDLEMQLDQVTARSAEQTKALELQIGALERRLAKSEERARAAEVRANEAETWLSRLHDTIVTSFRRPNRPDDGDTNA